MVRLTPALTGRSEPGSANQNYQYFASANCLLDSLNEIYSGPDRIDVVDDAVLTKVFSKFNSEVSSVTSCFAPAVTNKYTRQITPTTTLLGYALLILVCPNHTLVKTYVIA